ncbi:MAG: LysR family transcriptional regulator [Lawsonibacter sp.]|nr:LysR family transcriptional regulator [Lawsonibacter sp.]
MTQPPLSRQLKDLEDELGKKLLIRGSKKVTLTEDGMLLRKRAEELVDLMEKTKAELASSGDNINGEVYIGGGETDAISLFAQTAGKLQEKYPLVRYHIYSGDAEIVMEKLDKGLIDFGLLVGPVDVSKYDYMRLPISDIWGVLMRKDSPLAKNDAVYAEDLWDKPLIVSHQANADSDILSWLKRDIRKLNIVMTYNLIYNAAHFVKTGFGYAITLDKLVNTTGDSELCFRPLYPTLEAGLCIVWKKYQVFSKASKEFLRLLKNEWEAEGEE